MGIARRTTAVVCAILGSFFLLVSAQVDLSGADYALLLVWTLVLLIVHASLAIRFFPAIGLTSGTVFFFAYGIMPVVFSAATDEYPQANGRGLTVSYPGTGAEGDAIAILLIGMVAYYAGYWALMMRRAPAAFSSSGDRRSAAYAPAPLLGMSLVVLAGAVVSAWLLLRGDWSVLFASRIERDLVEIANVPSTAARGAISSFTLVTSVLALQLAIFAVRRNRGQLFGVPMILVTAAVAVVVSNPISAPRQWVGPAALSVAFLLSRSDRVRGALVVAYVAVSTYLFPALDAYRRPGRVRFGSLGGDSYRSVDFDQYSITIAGVGYVGENGHTLGTMMLGNILIAVPRAIWPSKPPSSGALLSEYLGHDFPNPSGPLWAEGFLDFGYSGTFLYLALIGAGAAALDRVVCESDIRNSPLAGLALVAATYQVLLLRGPLRGAVDIALILWVFALVYRRLVPHDATHDLSAQAPSEPAALGER